MHESIERKYINRGALLRSAMSFSTKRDRIKANGPHTVPLYVTGCTQGTEARCMTRNMTHTSVDIEFYKSKLLLLERISFRFCIVPVQRHVPNTQDRCQYKQSLVLSIGGRELEWLWRNYSTDTLSDTMSTFPFGSAVRKSDDTATAARRAIKHVDKNDEILLIREKVLCILRCLVCRKGG